MTTSKIRSGIFLLRKSQSGMPSIPAIRDADLPMEFEYRGSVYEVSRTKQGKLIMTKKIA